MRQAAGAQWWPVGSPRELLDANLAALAHEAPGQSAWIARGALVAPDARMGPGTVVCAGASIGAGARLERALALPGARVAAGAVLENAVAYGAEVWRDA